MTTEAPLINPKTLSNDELEYVIKTGCIPSRFIQEKSSNQYTKEIKEKQTAT